MALRDIGGCAVRDWFAVACASFSQLLHTAGVIAARFNKLDILEHLVATSTLSLTELKPCKVCVLCRDVSVIGKDRCSQDHEPSPYATIAHGAAAGGHLEVLRYLRARGASLKVADLVRSCLGSFALCRCAPAVAYTPAGFACSESKSHCSLHVKRVTWKPSSGWCRTATSRPDCLISYVAN